MGGEWLANTEKTGVLLLVSRSYSDPWYRYPAPPPKPISRLMLSVSYEFILYLISTFPISWIYFQQPGLCGHVQQVISLSLSERCLFMDMLWVQPVRRLDFLLDQVYLIPVTAKKTTMANMMRTSFPPPSPPNMNLLTAFQTSFGKNGRFFCRPGRSAKTAKTQIGGGGEIGIPSTRSSGWSFFSQWPDLSTRIMSPIFSHVLQIHTWHHRISTYPKQRTTYQVMSIWKTRRMRAKGLADIGFGKPGCRHGLSHERVHKNLHIEPNQDISCPQHTRTLTTPCCLAHPPPPLIGFGGGAGYLYPNYTLSIVA